MKFFLRFLILAAVFTVAETFGLACSCAPPQSPAAELKRATAVFSGRVVEVKKRSGTPNSSDGLEVVFEVNRAWKGIDRKTISVFTPSNSAACGYNFIAGIDYLVYSYDSGGMFLTSLCSRTKRLDTAQADLDELGPGEELAGGTAGGSQEGSEIKVKVGRRVSIKGEALTVRFVSVANDSRCPENARCIWEGDADIKVEVKVGRRTRIFHLHTSQRYAQEGEYRGYTVRLMSLSPHPKVGKRLKADSYTAVLRVTR